MLVATFPALETSASRLPFSLPNHEQRRRLWAGHLPSGLPTGEIALDRLASFDTVSGRDIRNAALEAAPSIALRVLRGELQIADARVTTADLELALSRIVKTRVG